MFADSCEVWVATKSRTDRPLRKNHADQDIVNNHLEWRRGFLGALACALQDWLPTQIPQLYANIDVHHRSIVAWSEKRNLEIASTLVTEPDSVLATSPVFCHRSEMERPSRDHVRSPRC